MKRLWLLSLALCLSLCACQLSPRIPEAEQAVPDAPAPEESTPEEPPEEAAQPDPTSQAPEDQTIQAGEALCRDILLDYGANEPENPVQEGWINASKGVSLYYRGAWGEEDPLTPGDYFTWRLHHLNQEGLSYEEQLSRYSFPDGRENAGWFFPQEEYEALLASRFAVTAQDLRDETFYNAELQGYQMPGGAGIGATPFVVYDHHEQSPQEDGNSLLSIYYTLVSPIPQAEPNEYYILEVLLAPDGSFRYQCCREDPNPSDGQQSLAVPSSNTN